MSSCGNCWKYYRAHDQADPLDIGRFTMFLAPLGFLRSFSLCDSHLTLLWPNALLPLTTSRKTTTWSDCGSSLRSPTQPNEKMLCFVSVSTASGVRRRSWPQKSWRKNAVELDVTPLSASSASGGGQQQRADGIQRPWNRSEIEHAGRSQQIMR
jgi:hypothetical protein